MSDILIDITNQSSASFDLALIRQAVSVVLEAAQVERATINVAVIDNAEIWQLNRKYLDHDYATDVLSFRLSDDGLPPDGDVIVSGEMAAAKAAEIGDAEWTPQRELSLYVIHGMLHLLGYDDQNEMQRAEMQRHERAALARLGMDCAAAFADRQPGGTVVEKGERSS